MSQVEPTAIATTERDISERKHIGELQAQSERLLNMVEHLPAGAIYVANGNLTMNRAAEELTGFKRDELKTLDQWFDKLYGKRAKKIRHLYEKRSYRWLP